MKYLVILSIFILSACTPIREEVIREVPIYTPIECTPTTHPSLEMFPVIWQIATSKEGNKVIALDGENYSSLGRNLERIVEYIQSQKLIEEYYLGCIDRHNKKGQQ